MQTRSRQKHQQQHQPPSVPSLPCPPIASSSSPLPSSSAGLLSLSEELLLLILCHLDARCLLVVGRAHRELRDAAAHPVSWQHSHYAPQCLAGFMEGLPQLGLLHSLVFSPQSALQLTDELLHRVLLHLPQLAELDLSLCQQLSNRAFVSLYRLLSRELQRVVFPRQSRAHLDSVAVSLTALRHVSLQSVSLQTCEWLGKDCLLHLSQLHRLERLELDCMQQLTDASFSFLQCDKLWRRLASLSLRECTQLTNATLGCLSHLPCLASLDVSGCWQLGTSGVRLLSSESSACRCSLQKLSMNECIGLTDDSAALYLLLPALSSLSLNGCSKLTAAALPELAAHPCLHSLQCDKWADDGSSAVAAQQQEAMRRLMMRSSSSLTSLSLGRWRLGSEAFSAACNRSAITLQHLGLAGIDGLQALSFLQLTTFGRLSSLVLDGMQLQPWLTRPDDPCAPRAAADRRLLALPALLSLSLRGCTRAANLLGLLHAPLRSLDVSRCPGLPSSTVESIAAFFPSLTALYAQKASVPRSALLRLSQLNGLELLDLEHSPLPLASLQIFTRPAGFLHLGSLCVTVAAEGAAVSRWLQRVRACHVGAVVRVEEVASWQRREEDSHEDDEREQPTQLQRADGGDERKTASLSGDDNADGADEGREDDDADNAMQRDGSAASTASTAMLVEAAAD